MTTAIFMTEKEARNFIKNNTNEIITKTSVNDRTRFDIDELPADFTWSGEISALEAGDFIAAYWEAEGNMFTVKVGDVINKEFDSLYEARKFAKHLVDLMEDENIEGTVTIDGMGDEEEFYVYADENEERGNLSDLISKI